MPGLSSRTSPPAAACPSSRFSRGGGALSSPRRRVPEMCGVCGIAAPGLGLDGGWASGQVRAMVDALAHRGPDDAGLHGAEAAVLGATRLAIRGLADGRQPMVDAGSGVVVVCN